MRSPYTQLYVHCVWSTWDRLPLVTPQLEKRVYGCIIEKCHELKCEVIAVGGVEDHVHLLVRFPSALAIATLIGEVKGSSSHLMTHQINPGIFFRWQGAYGAFTLPKDAIRTVTEYINNQKMHHAKNTLVWEWEQCETDAKP
jgi:putative transposase